VAELTFRALAADEADRVLEAVDGVRVNGVSLRVAPVPA